MFLHQFWALTSTARSKPRFSTFFGGQGLFLVPLGVAAGVQNLKLLNFEPIRQVRGVFASILGADFNREVKTLIFGPFWGVSARRMHQESLPD